MKYEVHVKVPFSDEFQAEVIPDYIETDDCEKALALAVQYLLDNGESPEEVKSYWFKIYHEIEIDGFKYWVKDDGEWRCAE